MGIVAKIIGQFYAVGREIDRLRRVPRFVRQPVISVGNISSGGRAKTPMVVELIWGLLQRRYDPIVLTRGYARKSTSPVFLDREALHFIETGEKVALSELSSELILDHVGDEALEIFVKTGARLLVGADRHRNAMWYLSYVGGSVSDLVFILDDGFQHWKMERDFDLVLYSNEDMKDDLLPLGRLREKASALERADIALLLGRDVEKVTLFPEEVMDQPPVVISTRAPDKSYRALIESKYGQGLRFVELKDHASREALIFKIKYSPQSNIVLGYKEAVKIIPWALLASHEGRPFMRSDIIEGKTIWVLGLRLKVTDEPLLWTHIEHMLEMKYFGDDSDFSTEEL